MGSVKYAPEQNSIVWKMKSLPGGKEYLMRAHFNLPSVTSEDAEGWKIIFNCLFNHWYVLLVLGRPPISVKFEIPYFTVSGIQVSKLFVVNIIHSKEKRFDI